MNIRINFTYLYGAKLGDPSCKELLPQRDHKDVDSEAKKWLEAIKVITTKYPDKDEVISVSAAVWADKQLESHCGQSHARSGGIFFPGMILRTKLVLIRLTRKKKV